MRRSLKDGRAQAEPQMQLKKLGPSDLMVSPLCLGGNVFGWTVDETQSFALLDELGGAGFNFVDTADVYSAWAPGNVGGESETIIGRWISTRGNRDKAPSVARSEQTETRIAVVDRLDV
jgi:hypothetical protein